MNNKFNRQVLEQVAKDGKTYASLAKEMAKALLADSGNGPPEVIPCAFLLPRALAQETMESHLARSAIEETGAVIYELKERYVHGCAVYELTRKSLEDYEQ